tara:strand:+ start:131 stop:406 length:276 start_codon:yes stop_codon:yes gene_type:complete
LVVELVGIIPLMPLQVVVLEVAGTMVIPLVEAMLELQELLIKDMVVVMGISRLTTMAVAAVEQAELVKMQFRERLVMEVLVWIIVLIFQQM